MCILTQVITIGSFSKEMIVVCQDAFTGSFYSIITKANIRNL